MTKSGARRIGKSTICEEFVKKEYESYILIDFAKKDKEIEMYFETYLNDLDTFLMLLQTHFGKKLTERKSLIKLKLTRIRRARLASES